MKYKRTLYFVLILLGVYGIVHFASWLYFLSTADKFIFDDGESRTELYRCDIRTLPCEIDTELNMSNKTGVLYSYSVLGGKMISRHPYSSGLVDGVVSNWYRNGRLMSTDTYVKGKSHGYFCWYSPKGNLISKVYSEDGNLVSVSAWHENGSRKTEIYFYPLGNIARSYKKWNEAGILIESYVNDINGNATSGYISVNSLGISPSQPVAYDVIGRTNFFLRRSGGVDN